jgi:hypothetical protein
MAEILTTPPPSTPSPNRALVVGLTVLHAPAAYVSALPVGDKPASTLVVYRLRGVQDEAGFVASSGIESLAFTPEQARVFVETHATLLRSLRAALEAFAAAAGKIGAIEAE